MVPYQMLYINPEEHIIILEKGYNQNQNKCYEL